MPMLVIENDHVGKTTSFFVFMEGVVLLYGQVLVLEERTFNQNVLCKRYLNSKFNVLVNLSTS